MGYSETGYEYPEYPEMKHDFSIDGQYYDRYTEDDHKTWQLLYDRQMKLIQKYAFSDYQEALANLPISGDKIPRFEDISDALYRQTGWELVPIPGLIPAHPFFTHLATKAFPVTHWIRKREQLDYLQEPDLFHDLFGHVPLLMNPTYGSYLAAYGRGGCRAFRMGNEKYLEMLARLYWYTVEFGLIKENEEIKIYGAGILSSPGEIVFSVDSKSPNRIAFNMERIMNTDFIISDFQETYWVIESIEQLFTATQQDFKPIYKALEHNQIYSPGEILPEDEVIHRGTGEYHRNKTQQQAAVN